MKYQVSIFSDMLMAGQLEFKLSQLFNCFANSFCTPSSVDCQKFNKAKCAQAIEEVEDNLIIFCENKFIDEIIIDNIQKLSPNKYIVDDLAVVFEKEGRVVAFLPIELDWQSLLKKILEKGKDKSRQYCEFHLFGRPLKVVQSQLQSLKRENQTLEFHLSEQNLLTDIYVSYKGENLLDNEKVKISNLFKDSLYSETSLTLGQVANELLRGKGLKLAIKEGVSGGKIISRLSHENLNFNEVMKLGQVEKLEKFTPENIYDEAFELSRNSGADVALVTSGNFDEKGLNLLIAIGDKNSINVYKNRFNAGRADCFEMATNCALFHLIKKLRQNDFAF